MLRILVHFQFIFTRYPKYISRVLQRNRTVTRVVTEQLTGCSPASPTVAIYSRKSKNPAVVQFPRLYVSAASCIHWNPKELGSNTTEVCLSNRVKDLPAKGESESSQKASFLLVSFYIGCYQKLWPRFTSYFLPQMTQMVWRGVGCLPT